MILIACVIALAWFAAAWLFVLPPFSPSPAFYENVEGGSQVYVCNGGEKGAPELPIRFTDEGQTATVTIKSKKIALRFAGVDFLGEIYRNGPWVLHLDPEANFSGPGGIRFSNCY